MNTAQTLDRYCHFFEQLTAADIVRFDLIYDTHAHFKDPFHEVHQLRHIQTIFAHMFTFAPDARFFIQQRFHQEQSAIIIWTMKLSIRQQPMSIEGTTHLVFNEQGLVALHRDYWDTGEELFSKLPLVGVPTRWLMKQFATPLE